MCYYSDVLSLEKPESGNHCRKPAIFKRVQKIRQVTNDGLSVYNDSRTDL